MVDVGGQEQENAVNTRFTSGNTDVYLLGKVNGQNVVALLEMGNEMSLVRPLDNAKSQRLLKVANGTLIKILEETQSVVSCRVLCLVTEQLDEMVLGSEWLERLDAVWNFRER